MLAFLVAGTAQNPSSAEGSQSSAVEGTSAGFRSHRGIPVAGGRLAEVPSQVLVLIAFVSLDREHNQLVDVDL